MALYVKADLHLKLQLVRLEVLVVAEVRALHRVDELMLVPLAASNSDWKKTRPSPTIGPGGAAGLAHDLRNTTTRSHTKQTPYAKNFTTASRRP